MNIITIVHQPRFGVFMLYDELLLLGKGGVTAYSGPTEVMLPYLQSLGEGGGQGGGSSLRPTCNHWGGGGVCLWVGVGEMLRIQI